MKNLFSSPRATRLLVWVMAICIGTLCFAVFWMWPYDEPDHPSITVKLCVLTVFSSLMLWRAYDWWKIWLVEYKYGLRLLAMERDKQAFDQTSVSNIGKPLPPTKTTLKLIEQPAKEKLRFPWASLVCCGLMVLALFLSPDSIDPISGWLLFAWVGAMLFMFRPYERWSNLFGRETVSHEAKEADDNRLLPLNKLLGRVNDSNYYRFYRRQLTELGFEPLGQQRYRHFFADPTGQVIAILGRDSLTEELANDYLSLISIDDKGCMIESSSLNRPYIEKWAACHERWNFQTLDLGDAATALTQHKEFATSGSSSEQFIAANEYPAFAKHVHEIASAAKIRYFNQYRVAFA